MSDRSSVDKPRGAEGASVQSCSEPPMQSLQSMAGKCQRLHLEHKNVANYYMRLHAFLQVPAGLLAAASSALTFATTPLGGDHEREVMYLVGVLTAIATMLHAVIASLAFHRKSQTHQAVSQECHELLHSIQRELPEGAAEHLVVGPMEALEDRMRTLEQKVVKMQRKGSLVTTTLTASTS